MTQESEVQASVEETEVEEQAEETTEVAGEEEKKQSWPVIVIGVVVALLAFCTLVVCIAAAIAGFSGRQDAASVTANKSKRFRKTTTIADQSAGGGELPVLVDRRHRVVERQCGKLFHSAGE